MLSHQLVDIPAHFLSATFSREGLFRTALVTRFQIIGVFLYVLDNVFLLDLSFETAKRAFNRLALLDSDLCHLRIHPLRRYPLVSSLLGTEPDMLGRNIS